MTPAFEKTPSQGSLIKPLLIGPCGALSFFVRSPVQQLGAWRAARSLDGFATNNAGVNSRRNSPGNAGVSAGAVGLSAGYPNQQLSSDTRPPQQLARP